MKNIAIYFLVSTACLAGPSPRARDLGIKFSGTPGKLNAITDVKDVAVNHITLIEKPSGDAHAVRTGVTAIFPNIHKLNSVLPGNYFIFNGNGDISGGSWLKERGLLEGPILFTNTYSWGLVRDSVRSWAEKKFPNTTGGEDTISLPVVAETYDGVLNDIKGKHIKEKHVFKVLDNPTTGAVAEGNVGGGTGMMCFRFKCGIGTSSRIVSVGGKNYTVGVLVQSNFGAREDLLITGKEIGKIIADLLPTLDYPNRKKDGSLLAAVATDAPLSSTQLEAVAKRVSLGAAKTGAIGDPSSGEIFIAFSTQKTPVFEDEKLGAIFRGVIQATEEAILNSLVAAKTMEGLSGNKVYAIPHDRLIQALK